MFQRFAPVSAMVVGSVLFATFSLPASAAATVEFSSSQFSSDVLVAARHSTLDQYELKKSGFSIGDLEELTKTAKSQEREISDLKRANEDQKRTVDNQKRTLEDLQRTVSEQKRAMEDLKRTVDDLKRR